MNKLVWQGKRLTAFLDSRKIKVPESLKGENQMLCDYWDCSLILSAEMVDNEYIFETSIGKYRVSVDLLDPKSRAIAEDLIKSRPSVWW